MIIRAVHARQILDSRGNPTIEVDITTDDGIARAGVPSGASTGTHEALELRDDKKEYHGLSVMKAVKNVNTFIAPHLIGKDCTQQFTLDRLMIDLDGTENKRNFGANAILGASIALCKAGASARKMHWYAYIHQLYLQHNQKAKLALPVPFMNVINGGKHAGNQLPFQEFMIAPTGAHSMHEAIQMGSEVYHELKAIIKKKYGIDAVNVGDEGGFAPPILGAIDAIELLMQAIHNAGYEGKVKIALDAAASEMLSEGKYDVEFKKPKDKTHKTMTVHQMHEQYVKMVQKYPVISIEDPFDQEDFAAHAHLLKAVKQHTQIVGDDLLVTNVLRVRKAIQQNAASALLLKVNQIGSITESLQAAAEAHHAGWHIMVSHRSGETEDPFIADLAVGIGAGQIKAGAPCRTERTAKYNQLLRIEESIKNENMHFKYGW